MIYLIGGSSHSGKTLLAQKLLEAHRIPYLLIDHLKMGLIRSGVADLSPESPDAELTPYLWNIVREMVKTALENGQHLIVEGCYIPCHYAEDFSPEQRGQIRALWLILSEGHQGPRERYRAPHRRRVVHPGAAPAGQPGAARGVQGPRRALSAHRGQVSG